MKSRTTRQFWQCYDSLPAAIQQRARKQYRLFLTDPSHPSLNFKSVAGLWSVRVTDDYRAVAVFMKSSLTWVWIGTHADYELRIRS